MAKLAEGKEVPVVVVVAVEDPRVVAEEEEEVEVVGLLVDAGGARQR